MRKFLYLIIFFLLTPGMIFVSIALLSYHMHQNSFLTQASDQQVAYAALPSNQNVLGVSIETSDNRIYALQTFLSKYHSPLAPYASLIIDKADEYGIDYRLLPAIAMQETTLCKKTLPQAHYNCWGYGIWGKKVTSFASYDEAIDTISHYFANRRERGIESLSEIGTIYNPGNTNHWKENVADFMTQISHT